MATDALAEAAISILVDAISNLFQSVTSLLKDKGGLIRNAKVELEKLQEKLERLQKNIKDVEQEPFLSNERNIDLEAELKDVLYDAHNIIEGYRTTIVLCKRDKVSKPWTIMCSCFKEHVSASYKLANDIKKINRRLNREERRPELEYFFNTTPRESENPNGGKHDDPRETTYLISTVQPPMGRADDKEKVKQLLFDGFTESSALGTNDISIVSIVGRGGIGKTTLAKMVFNEVKEQFRNRSWWVCVSEKPNRTGLLQKILKEVCKESKGEPLKGSTSFSDLCTRLQSELLKSKFLLVLDDLRELHWWDREVEDILWGGAKESKILITSRKVEISQRIGAKIHKLQKMSSDESWSLFLRVAKKQEHELESRNLKGIGEKIVAKCDGLPLVVQMIGSLMHRREMTRKDWKDVENNEIWELSSKIGGTILPGLMLSYDDLPHYLKSCFVYCCIYPKDYEIERDQLVMQWMAHGLIDQDKDIDVETTANQWINKLINRFMIEENEDKKLKLHDMLHDLALYIGGKEYSLDSATNDTRHLSLFGVDDAEVHKRNALEAAYKLRTLLGNSYFHSKSDLSFKWLKVLSLRECQMDELPKSIEELSLLKYLDLSSSDVKRLPNSIGRLYNLQTLDLSNSKIEELPKEMGELCNLRYLGLKDTEELKFVAKGLGKLTNLRTLDKFLVCDDKWKTRGCNINELKELKKLKGELSIEGLCGGRVKVMDAKKAKLKAKHELIGVKFRFNGQEDNRSDNASKERRLLEALEPPHGIGSLEISSYKGDGPAWYLDSNYVKLRMLCLDRCPSLAAVTGIKSLEELKVWNCPTLSELPSMPLLKSLEIEKCDGLNTIGDLPALELLEITHCDGLNTIGDLPALESLKITDCDRLNTIGDLPALESLEIKYCVGLKRIGDMPAVKTLRLSLLNILKHLPTRLPSLEELHVDNLPNWKSTFTSMPSLKKATFFKCPKMQIEGLSDELAGLQERDCSSARLGWKLPEQLPNLIWLELDSESGVLVSSPLPSQVSTFLPSLKYLKLVDNTNVDEVKWGRVPEWVWGLSQLEELHLYHFSEDISLGGHWQGLPKLRKLTLWGFPNLKSLVDVNDITPQQQQNGTTSPSDAQQQQIAACLSNLQSLSIHSCPALELPQELSDHIEERSHKRSSGATVGDAWACAQASKKNFHSVGLRRSASCPRPRQT